MARAKKAIRERAASKADKARALGNVKHAGGQRTYKKRMEQLEKRTLNKRSRKKS
jgi:hypothetical protein